MAESEHSGSRERKRLVRLIPEVVMLIRKDQITTHVRFKGGMTRTLTVPVPLNAWQQRATSLEVVREIDRLVDHNTYSQIATVLNEHGLRTSEGRAFTSQAVARLMRRYSLKPRYDRLRKAGVLSVNEMAAILGVSPPRVTIGNRHGLLRGHAYNDKNDCLFEHPDDHPPHKSASVKLSKRIVDEL
jgi:hypothetical protein